MNDATVRVESTFKNARLYNAIKERSICLAGADEIRLQALHRAGPIKAFCDLHDLSLQGVYLLLNLKRSPRFVGPLNKPMKKRGHFTPMARRLAELLDADPAWLFPDELYAAGLRKTVGHLTTQQFVALTSGHARKELQVDSPQTDTVLQRELSEALTTSLAMLTPRESRVLQLRTGIATGEEVTLDEVAKNFGVSRERIRQIEAKAYRKMRHKSRAQRLKPFIDALGTRRYLDPWK